MLHGSHTIVYVASHEFWNYLAKPIEVNYIATRVLKQSYWMCSYCLILYIQPIYSFFLFLPIILFNQFASENSDGNLYPLIIEPCAALRGPTVVVSTQEASMIAMWVTLVVCPG